METIIHRWLKEQIPGFTFKAAAEETGITFSTLRRHLIDEGKNGNPVETLVAICRAYNLSPIEGLIEAGVISEDDVQRFAEGKSFSEGLSTLPLQSLFARIREELDTLEQKTFGPVDVVMAPKGGIKLEIADPTGQIAPDPDYSKLSDEDVKSSYDLAALEKPEQIGDDELPHEP